MLKKIFVFILMTLLLAGCAAPAQEIPEATQPLTEPTAAPTLPEPAEPETTQPATEETLPPPPTLHSGIREDGSFDEGTLFIGDSQSYLLIMDYLKPSGLIGDAKYAVQCGSQLTAFWDSHIRPTEDSTVYCAFSPEFQGMTFCEAAAQMGSQATAIYLMWGSNYTPDATAQSYIDIVECLLEICPYATVHLQTIPYGEVAYVTVNGRITGAWDYFQSIGETRVTLVDTFGGIGTSVGSDRVHVTPLGREKWYQTLLLHAETLGLEQ